MKQITLTKPDDWHLHLRDGPLLKTTVNDAARQFARAIVMPNLLPPIISVPMAQAYRARIIKALSEHSPFTPLMTLYLTDELSPQTITQAKNSTIIYGCKLYPAGATTHSDSGVTDIQKIYPVLEAMENVGLPLLIHGEVTDDHIDVFDREKYFIDDVLAPLINDFPNLKIVLEHITTKRAVEFIEEASPNIAATITAHHLLLNRNAIFSEGINPHYYCLPILKRSEDQARLIKAATSGNPKFFLGTDSAPHAIEKKECSHGCAGIYTSFSAIELYAEAFENADELDKLEGFASFHGADFYGLPRNTETITLKKESWTVPDKIKFGDSECVPFRSGDSLPWKLAPQSN